MNHASLSDDNDFLLAGQRLSRKEEYWRDHHHWLLQSGYQLRPRFAPDWKPSWKTTGKMAILCEDGVALLYGQVIDATRIADGSLVALKKISIDRNPVEEEISAFLSSKALITDPRNHCVPILEIIRPPDDADAVILVLPFLRPYDSPPFDTFGEVIDCFKQLFEGINFMHQHHVAHRDINSNNFLLNAQDICPGGFHPSRVNKKPNLSGPATYLTRTQRPSKYCLIDFGISCRYDPAKGPPLELPIIGGDRTVPEFKNPTGPVDPFPTDVYYVGNMIRQEFLEGRPELEIKRKKGFGFMKSLIDDMVQDDPSKRPTMEQVVIRFELIVAGISSWKLRSRIVPEGEKFMKGLRRSISHWKRRLIYIVKHVPPVPSTQS